MALEVRVVRVGVVAGERPAGPGGGAAARGWRRRRRGPRGSSGSSGWRSGSVVGQFTNAIGTEVPRGRPRGGQLVHRAASQRSVGLASAVAREVPCRARWPVACPRCRSEHARRVPLDADDPGTARGTTSAPQRRRPARAWACGRRSPCTAAETSRISAGTRAVDARRRTGRRARCTTRRAGRRPGTGRAGRPACASVVRGQLVVERRRVDRVDRAPPGRRGRPSRRTSAGSARPRWPTSPGWCPGVVLPRFTPGRKVLSPPAVCSRKPSVSEAARTDRPSTCSGAGVQSVAAGRSFSCRGRHHSRPVPVR